MADRKRFTVDMLFKETGSAKVIKKLDDIKKRSDKVRRSSANMVMGVTDKTKSTLDKIGSRLTNLTKKERKIVVKVSDKVTGAMESIFSKITKMGLIGAGTAGFAVGASIKKSMDFESQMSSVGSLLSGDDKKKLPQLQALALKQGADTKYSALEAAQGLEELVKAGVSVSSIMGGSLTAALNLATAGDLGLADSAAIMSTAMNAFKADGLSASKAADILAGAANASATDVMDLKESLAAVSGTAALSGLSLQDTAAALGIFANNGVKGSDAGTSLKTMIANLPQFTKTATKHLTAMGVAVGNLDFFDATGKIKGLSDIAEILHQNIGKLNKKEQLKALTDLFGSDAIRAGGFLTKEGASGVKKFMDEMMRVKAVDVAREKMNNAAGAVEQFRGAVETLQISALAPTLPFIRKFANAAADFATKYTPQITAGVDKLVKKANRYFHSTFLDNPDFKKLDIEGKVKFAVEKISEKLGVMANDALKKIGPTAASLGTSFMTSFGSAMVTAVTTNPLLALLLGTYAGLKTGGVVGLTIGLSIAAAPWVLKLLNWISDNSPNGKAEKRLDNIYSMNQKLDKEGSKDKPLFGSGGTMKPYVDERTPFEKTKDGISDGLSWVQKKLRGYATGGILTKPHVGMVAEAGPEAVIPLRGNRKRSLGLLQEAGRRLGGSANSDGGGGGGLSVAINAPMTINTASFDRQALIIEIGTHFVDQVEKALENRG